jgi:hypothetical protein
MERDFGVCNEYTDSRNGEDSSICLFSRKCEKKPSLPDVVFTVALSP